MTLLSFFNRKKDEQTATRPVSLNAMTLRRLCKDKMALCSLIVIGLFALMAFLGYTITPDPTPCCNQQYLELATLPPFSKATFLCVEKANADTAEAQQGFFDKLVNGEPLPYTAIPIYEYHKEGDTIVAETFTGSTPNDGDIVSYAKDEVVKIETRTFFFGTDGYGRDVLSQIMIGSRVSLSVGFIAIIIALLIGITLGALAAYYGGWVDNVIVWLINVVWSIPTILLVIAITFALGKGFWQVFIAVGLTMWVDIARVVRGQVFSIKEKEYVEAARALGYRTPRIIFKHILPNILGAVRASRP